MKALTVKPSINQQITMLEKQVHTLQLHIEAFDALLNKMAFSDEDDEIFDITTKGEVLAYIEHYEKIYKKLDNQLLKLLSKRLDNLPLKHSDTSAMPKKQAPEKQSLEKQASEIQSTENPPTNKILNNKVLSNKILNNNTTTDSASKEPATSQTEKSPNKTIKLKNKTLINKTTIKS